MSLEECIAQERLTIKVLETEEAYCKGCQIKAIKYHKAVLVYLEELLIQLCDILLFNLIERHSFIIKNKFISFWKHTFFHKDRSI